MTAISKALYLPLSVTTSVAGGLLASAVFSRVWKKVDDSGEGPPDPKDLNRSGREALMGAAMGGTDVRCAIRLLPPRRR